MAEAVTATIRSRPRVVAIVGVIVIVLAAVAVWRWPRDRTTYIYGASINSTGMLCFPVDGVNWTSGNPIMPPPTFVQPPPNGFGVDGRFTRTSDDTAVLDLGTDDEQGRRIPVHTTDACS
jgi:hypothetical protein